MFKKIQRFFFSPIFGTLLITGGFASVILGFALEKFFVQNKAPYAQITFNTADAAPYEYLYFDGSSSYDPEGEELAFKWFIDNKLITNTPSFSHAFMELKTYHVQLQVCDKSNNCNQDSVFVRITAPDKVHSIKDALRYFRYRVGWNSLIRKEIKYYEISSVSFFDPYYVTLAYDYKLGGKYYLLYSEHNRKLFGIWKDGDGEGELELVFNDDYQKANGWWKYENDSRKYDLILQKITSNE